MERWDVREILDFVSVRGLFQKGGADTKVIVVICEAQAPPSNRKILHATFRRSGRASAERGFDIDYYDMHWLPQKLALGNDGVWRCDLLGGGRVLGFVDRLRKLRTLGEYASNMGWDWGEGFVEGARGVARSASHIIGKPLLPSDAIGDSGINPSAITTAPDKPIEGSRSASRFTPPMLLVREHMDLFHDVWTEHYLTYKDQVVGFCARTEKGTKYLHEISSWLKSENLVLKAFIAAISVRLFTRKATSVSCADISVLPYPPDRKLRITPHEKILINDVVEFYRDLIRLGENSIAMKSSGIQGLPAFNHVFTSRINGVYRQNKLRPMKEYSWPGVICQPYVFGEGKVDWTGADEFKGKLDALLHERRGGGLNVTRIARLYDGACIYLLKPDRLRYWLRSVALRDADETLADLSQQGF